MPPRSSLDEYSFHWNEQLTISDDPCATTSLAAAPAYAPLDTWTLTKKQRTVAFSPQVEIRDHLHISDISHNEKHHAWYNRDDMKFFKKDARHASELFASGQLQRDNEEYCRRGVEFRSPMAARQRRQERYAAILAVLDEQNDVDQEALRETYNCFTIRSRVEACARGAVDARDA